jgi:hypothetical protein
MSRIGSKNNPTANDWGRTRGIRAVRLTDNRKECEQRLAAFGLFKSTFDSNSDDQFALRIARALRAERRAARTGGGGYDPMRHFVLARLDRRLKRSKRHSAPPDTL